jgi:hypothetical protein
LGLERGERGGHDLQEVKKLPAGHKNSMYYHTEATILLFSKTAITVFPYACEALEEQAQKDETVA